MPSTEKPVAIGINVPSYICPINVPIVMDIIDETQPVIAAAIPAICPIGSIASAFRFPKVNPKQKNKTAAYPKNIHSWISTKKCIDKNTKDAKTIEEKEKIQILRMPNFSTIRELMIDESAIIPARQPK